MHISDLHVHQLPRRLADYRSKRFLGGLNLLLRRRQRFPRERARRLVEHLQALEWQHLLISGDLTQLGTSEEFRIARELLAPLLARGPGAVTVLPGNHDRYVAAGDGVGAFEHYFGEFAPEGDVGTRRLTQHWWLAAWDSARPAPWLSASGAVRRATLEATDAWMAGLPPGARVMVANHYPVFFPPPHRYSATHDLTNQDEVDGWLRSHPVRLYLHGHVHHNWITQVDGRHGPITAINSASSTQRPRPDDPSAFHRIVLDGPDFRVEPQQFA